MAIESDLIRRYCGAFTPQDCEEIISHIDHFEKYSLMFHDKTSLHTTDNATINVAHDWEIDEKSTCRISELVLPKFKPCDISSNEQVLDNNKKKLFHMILDNSKSKYVIEEIINKTKEDNENFYLLGVSYWYLDEFSCVLVKRNELWFKKSLSEIENVWNIIEKERIDGYEHRASKKRRPSIDNTEKVGCLIQLNEDSM